MAWCPHCTQDRPIQRQVIPQGARCDYCGKKAPDRHKFDCRGPVPGALDVCSYCNTPVFSKAVTKADFETALQAEMLIKKASDDGDFRRANNKKANDNCFVVTATMGGGDHPVVAHMRRFRDQVLMETSIGNRFIEWYYAHGPGMARLIANSVPLRLLSYSLIVFPIYLLTRFWMKLRARLGP